MRYTGWIMALTASVPAGETQACAEAAAAQVGHLEVSMQALSEDKEQQAAQHEASTATLRAEHEAMLAASKVHALHGRSSFC